MLQPYCPPTVPGLLHPTLSSLAHFVPSKPPPTKSPSKIYLNFQAYLHPNLLSLSTWVHQAQVLSYILSPLSPLGKKCSVNLDFKWCDIQKNWDSLMLPLLSAGGSHWGFSLGSNPLKTSSFILLVSSSQSYKSAKPTSICASQASDHFQLPLNSLLLFKAAATQIHTFWRQWAVQWHGPHPSCCNYVLVLSLPCSLTIVLHLPRDLGLKFYRRNELGLTLYVPLFSSPIWFSKLLLVTLKALRWIISQTSLLYSVTQN